MAKRTSCESYFVRTIAINILSRRKSFHTVWPFMDCDLSVYRMGENRKVGNAKGMIHCPRNHFLLLQKVA